MNKLLLTSALIMLSMPAMAREYTIKEVSDPAGTRPYYFEPADLTIQPGDTVVFMNMQDDMHNVMFNSVPKQVDSMIMGPEQEKEGEKWSYTFTVPGSYHFHCHPHESLGMEGTLIVGQASKPGETKLVSHESMEGHHDVHAKNDLPEGKGIINTVDTKNHIVNMTHKPIPALKWPGMTMDFMVSGNIDLSNFKTGDSVEFSLKLDDKNQYLIVDLEHDHVHEKE